MNSFVTFEKSAISKGGLAAIAREVVLVVSVQRDIVVVVNGAGARGG